MEYFRKGSGTGGQHQGNPPFKVSKRCQLSTHGAWGGMPPTDNPKSLPDPRTARGEAQTNHWAKKRKHNGRNMASAIKNQWALISTLHYQTILSPSTEFHHCRMHTTASSRCHRPRACHITGARARSERRTEALVLRGGHLPVATASQGTTWHFRSSLEGQPESAEAMFRICTKDQQQARGSEIEGRPERHDTAESIHRAIKFNNPETVITCRTKMKILNHHFKGSTNRCICTDFILSIQI